MNDRNESILVGSYDSGARSRIESGSTLHVQGYVTKSGPAACEATAIVQKMSQVSLQDDDYGDDNGAERGDYPIEFLGKNQSKFFGTTTRSSSRTAPSVKNSLRNGVGHTQLDVESVRGASGHSMRTQSQFNEPSFRIYSRDPTKRDADANDTAIISGSNAPGGFDNSSQRSATETSQSRAGWLIMKMAENQDGDSQSQSLASGSNSQSAAVPAHWTSLSNNPSTFPSQSTVPGGSQPSKVGVPMILQKPSVKSISGAAGNGIKPTANDLWNEQNSVARQIRSATDRDKKPLMVSSNDNRQQLPNSRPLYSTATSGRSAQQLQPQPSATTAVNSLKQSQVGAHGGSKLQKALDSKSESTSFPPVTSHLTTASTTTSTSSDSIAKEALANLRAFEKRRAKMRFAVNIADEAFTWDATNACDALTDNTDYLVVGVCGLHAAGKSTVASLLADPASLRATAERLPFAVETAADLKLASARTVGIEMLVTSERTIILDTQPLLSFALVDAFEADATRRISFPYEQFVEEQSVKLLAFLFSVCHLVIVVLDGAFGESETRIIDLAKLIQLADLVRPSVDLLNVTASASTNSDDPAGSQKVARNSAVRRGKESSTPALQASDQFLVPAGRDTLSNVHLAFVENKLPPTAFLKRHADRMSSVIDRCFDEQLCSTLTVRSGAVSMINCALVSGYDGDSSAPINSVNYFALPRRETCEKDQSSSSQIPGFETFVRNLRKQVLSAPIRDPIAMLAGNNGAPSTPLTEKKWFDYASRCCNAIRNIRMPNFPDEFSQFVLGLGGPT